MQQSHYTGLFYAKSRGYLGLGERAIVNPAIIDPAGEEFAIGLRQARRGRADLADADWRVAIHHARGVTAFLPSDMVASLSLEPPTA